VEVLGSGTFNDPWIVTLADIDASGPAVSLEYDLDGQVLADNASSGFQIVERLTDDIWNIDRSGTAPESPFAVFPDSADARGAGDVYFGAFQTVASEGSGSATCRCWRSSGSPSPAMTWTSSQPRWATRSC